MKKITGGKIIILGATGMVGRVVYSYLYRNFPYQVFGTAQTTSSSSPFFLLQAHSFVKDLQRIEKKTGKIDLIINCIGVLKNEPLLEKMILVNSLFPQQLSRYCHSNQLRLIHISSDAVFAAVAGKVTVDTLPCPSDLYGASKWLGEVGGENVVTVRTSFLGFDPVEKKGLLEWVKNFQQPKIPGFINQKWSGCTTLQFAQLCEQLSDPDLFTKLTKKTSVLHFAPLTASKYLIVKKTLELLQLTSKVQSVKTEPVTRVLKKEWPFLTPQTFSDSLEEALQELYKLERATQVK